MKKIWKEWKWVIAVGILILVVGVAIRLYNLTLLPVFADEAIYIRWAQIMANESTLRFLPLSDGKQPLFMWVLMFLVNRFSDPLFIGRLVSVVAGTGTAIGVFALSYSLFKNKLVSLIAAVIYTLSPITLFFDRMALVDSMLAFFGVWVVFFGVLTAKTGKLDMAMITGFFLGFALLTKSPAIFFVILLPITWIFAKGKIKLIPLYIVILVIAFGMYNILRLGPNFHLIALRNQDYVYPYSHVLTDPLNPLKGHMGGIWNYFVLIGPLSLVFLVVFGLLGNFRKNFVKLIPLIVFSITPIIVMAEYSKVVTARYILFVIPYFAILGASAFSEKKKLLQSLGVLGLIAFLIQSALADYKLLTNVEAAPIPHGDRSGYLEEWTAGQGIKEISEYIKKEHVADPGTKIVVGTEGYFGTLPQGLEMYLQSVDNVVVIGVGLGINQVPESLKESRDAGNKTYLVINKSRLIENPDKIKLRLVRAYPKSLRREGSREYVVHGPREELYFFEVE